MLATHISIDMILKGRSIAKGTGSGMFLYTNAPISFLGGVDAVTGIIIDEKHPLCGQSVAGKVFAFPYGKGSTVGSYVMYGLARNNVAPAAIINAECDTITAIGAIISSIPMVDRLDGDLSCLSGMITVNGSNGEVSTRE
jgi:predicted aconitase with swiveling domain